jgi:hypothetical protein
MLTDIRGFITVTASLWMQAGLIKANSFGVELITALQPGGNFAVRASYEAFGLTDSKAEHPMEWYCDNAHGKNLICLVTQMDSHEAVRLWPGLVSQITGAYPWGGAVIDLAYGLIIGTSGFKEDEDLLFSRTIRNYVVMLLDRGGDDVITDARQRGAQRGTDGIDRFTRLIG